MATDPTPGSRSDCDSQAKWERGDEENKKLLWRNHFKTLILVGVPVALVQGVGRCTYGAIETMLLEQVPSDFSI